MVLLLESEKCPVCGSPVKKENLKSHYAKVHPRRAGSLVQPKTVPLARVPSAFRSHKKKNMLLLSLIVLAVIGVSIVTVEFVAANTLRMHIHPQLSITLNGSPVQVPTQIGIDPSLWRDHSLDRYGVSGLAPIHTHDTSGLIHVESNTVRDFTLHQFLAIWGQPSDGSAINGHTVSSLSVDGQSQPSPAQDVVFKDKQQIAMTLTT
jgi:hypothetical protein